MIEARGITFGYRGGVPVVRDWNGTIARGETASIVGRSGTGKSTLLYILGTLVRPWSGTLRIGAVRVEGLSDHARSDVRASAIGFVFQDALLDARRSVIDNILEGAAYRGADRATARRRAHELLDQLDVDVEPNRRATDLSGGQSQRVALCRALLNDPQLILADEPTGNLDRDNARLVEEVLFDQAERGAAVVIVTHDESLAVRCQRRFQL